MTGHKINYERAREIAHTGNDQERKDLAKREDAQPEILYFLVDDVSSGVRQNIAGNIATPRKANLLLANDDEEQVRLKLAQKIAALVPDLDPEAQKQLYDSTMETLGILVRDQAIKVRQILAETLKDVAHAPPDIINSLARDTEIVVARPVLTCSPVLSSGDLLEIITSTHVVGVNAAIAERTEVDEIVSEAIIETDDMGAIALLLGNESAQIREETLDAIIDRAAEVESWHLPLVKRTALPLGAVFRLARFVAANLVEALQNRGDLNEEEVSEILEIVESRIKDGTIDPDWAKEESREGKPALVDVDELWDEEQGKKTKQKPVTPLQIAQDMKENNRLNGESVMEAMGRGDVDLVIAAIAVLSEIPLALVEKAMDSQDPVTVVAVCWKAELSSQMAEQVQSKIAGIKKDEILRVKGSKYPVTEIEMKEKLDQLKSDAPAD